jgi:parallel beta-helix repeat protein
MVRRLRSGVLCSAVVMLGCSPVGGDEQGDGSSGGETGGTTDDPTGGGGLPEGCDAQVVPGDDDVTALLEVLIGAAEGTTVCLGEGTFMLDEEIGISSAGLTLRGAGRDRTILDFSLQDLGGNGLKVTGDGVTMTAFTVRDTPGDGIRGDMVKDIVFDDVAVVWTAEASLENGAYGFYPVGCEGVTIRNSLVRGARDAGVYVGQSFDILVEDNEAVGNVAGIEIENSSDAVVRRNHAHDNTGGILIFNLPGLEVKDGKRTLAYENIVENNNIDNFGEPGTVVSLVPPGIGFMILAADDNELRQNQITGNKSTGVVITQYSELLFEPYDDASYDVFAQGNYIHDNTFEDNGTDPAELILTVTAMAKPGYDMLLDGCVDEDADNADGAFNNCFTDNGAATYLDFDLCNGFAEQSTDMGPVTCEHTPLMAPN